MNTQPNTNDADETESDLETENGPDEYPAPPSWWAGQPNPNATEHNPEGL
jgi:hypothetical protein